MPSGNFGLSNVDTSDKNSGQDAGSTGAASSDDDRGYIFYLPIASVRGHHLATVASAIRDTNATAAKELEDGANQPVGNQVAFTGQQAAADIAGQNLVYQGGKMMVHPYTLNVYLIYYGDWTDKQKNILNAFVNSLDQTKVPMKKGSKTASVTGWWAINSRNYRNHKGKAVTASVKLAGTYVDTKSQAPFGTQRQPMQQSHIEDIVRRATDPKNPRRLPLDTAGAYAVLTSKDVYMRSFCYPVCAYHTSARFFGSKLAYAFVGNSESQCPMGCTYRYLNPMFVPPNGDLGVDAMVDKLAHELAEIATNPLHGPGDKPGWCVKDTKIENADICEIQYGPVTYENDMVVWNMKGINDMRFLVQMNYDPIRKKCVLQYNSP